MPTVTVSVPAEVFVRYQGVKVYRTYKYDDLENPSDHFFTLDPDFSESCGEAFDVRELPDYAALVGSKQPPYLTQENFPALEASPGYREAQVAWDDWHAQFEDRITEVIRRAIAAGVLKAVDRRGFAANAQAT
jgi:hypothetical protein